MISIKVIPSLCAIFFLKNYVAMSSLKVADFSRISVIIETFSSYSFCDRCMGYIFMGILFLNMGQTIPGYFIFLEQINHIIDTPGLNVTELVTNYEEV